MRDLVLQLHAIGAIKFGNFQLKSGITSPFYIDLRLVPSYPSLLKLVAAEMWKKSSALDFSLICGVPLSALPMATALSLSSNIPMIMYRKEAKDHGTKKTIEGVYRPGQRCLIIEDVMTSGASIAETAGSLEREGLIVEDIVLLIDRQQGGKEYLEERNLHPHAVMTIEEVLPILLEEGKMDPLAIDGIRTFLNKHSKVTAPLS